jgi:hypothetical protein
MTEALRQRVHRIHQEIEWLASHASSQEAPPARSGRAIVEDILPTLRDVAAGLDLIEAFRDVGDPISTEVIQRWIDGLAATAPRWAGTVEVGDLPRLMDALELRDLDWGLIGVYATAAQGRPLHEAGRSWAEHDVAWSELALDVRAAALNAYERSLDDMLGLLSFGEGMVEHDALRILPRVASELVPLVRGSDFAPWGWLAQRVAVTQPTDGLYNAYDVVEAIESAFEGLPRPERPEDVAGALRILLLDLPGFLLEGCLGDLQRKLGEDLGVGDLSGLAPATIERRLRKALRHARGEVVR